MLYFMATLRVAPQNVEKFNQVFEEYLALGEKHGRKLVGQWQTIIGPRVPREIIDLWAFDDLAHRQRFLEAAAKDEEMQKVLAKLTTFIVEESTKAMVPLPPSPLK